MTKLTGKKRKYICEELEPRILLSAGIEGLIYDSGWEPDVTLEAETDAAQIIALFNNSQSPSSIEPTSEVVFIDSSLPDYQLLITDLVNNDDTNRQFEIILLNEQDGIAQITAYLESQENIDAIHFFTHGEDGQIQLGDDHLSLSNIENFSSDLLLWNNALDENADILFYGCDVASTVDGLSLIQQIGTLTDADIAASDDLTGNSELGGDWQLEKTIGSIETNIALSTELQTIWNATLAIITFQDGFSGYTGTVDTQLDQLTPNTSYDDDADISADGGANSKQALIRFDNIFGAGANQIAYGSTINSATLTFNVTDGTTGAANVEMYAMLVNWNDSSTWNSLSSGVSTDDVEASSTVDSLLNSPNDTGSKTFTGLGTTLQSWSDGGTNYGWVITNNTTNNWDFSQSDGSNITNPILTVDYSTNAAPVFTSSATPSIPENTTAVVTLATTDADGDPVTYSITGGDDAGLFTITSGVLNFITPPDADTPGSFAGTNVYDVQVTADDGNGGLTPQDLTVTVTDVNEAPVFTSTATPSIPENTTAVVALATTDDDGDIPTYSITGGNDQLLFTITGGVLNFITPPDADVPGSFAGTNVYDVQVTADDGNLGLTPQNLTVTVTDVNEAPVFTSTATPSIPENTTAVVALATTDDDGDAATYSITGGDDAGLFTITGGVLNFITPPDSDVPGSFAGTNVYDVQVTADDGNLGLTPQNLTVTVTNVNEAPTSNDQQFSVSGNSVNGSLVGIVTASDTDAGDTLSYSITDGTGVGSFAIDSNTGQLTIVNSNSLYSEVAQVYTLSVLVTDSSGNTSTSNITISVSPSSNSNPVIVSPPPPEQTNPSPERNDFIAEPTLQLAGYIFNSHLITHLDPTSDSSENNGTNEPNEKTGSRDVKTDWLTPENNEVGADYISFRTGGAFYNALDKMNQDIDESEETGGNNVFTAGVRGTGIALTAGFASWVLRGSSLLASFLSTIPVWRGLDPLPILAAARKKQKKDVNVASSKKNSSDADDIDEIFDENGNRIHRNTVQDA